MPNKSDFESASHHYRDKKSCPEPGRFAQIWATLKVMLHIEEQSPGSNLNHSLKDAPGEIYLQAPTWLKGETPRSQLSPEHPNPKIPSIWMQAGRETHCCLL